MTARLRRLALPALVILLVAACSTAVSGTAAGPSIQPEASSPATTRSSVPPTRTTSPASTSAAPTPSPDGPSGSAPDGPSESAAAAATPVTTPTMTYGTYPPTDLTGEDYGFVTAVDLANSQLTLDRISWFTGQDAQQACNDDGVTTTDNNWCTGYYFRNNNPALRVVAVSPQARISTLVGSRSAPSDLATVAARIATLQSPYRLTVTDGVITVLEELYQP